MSRILIAAAVSGLAALPLAGLWAKAPAYDTPVALGEALFHDTSLSRNGTQACATCHNPDFAFTDPRPTDAGRAVSLGDDGASLGGRNAPTAMYAMLTPDFHIRPDGVAVGGQFLDGREADLEGQAGGPPLNPVEMGQPDKAAVVARLQENPDYVAAFEALYGADVLDTPEAGYDAMTQAIAAFERRADVFAPFESKYDRWLRGEAELNDQEELGRVLFFSQQFTNCNLCHQLRESPLAADETFSNYEYHNIGTPPNPRLAELGAVAAPDNGLLDNPEIDAESARGQFRVPTLRNVAVTGPYMHNGVFEDLRTVVLFYNKYNTLDPDRLINPETGAPFAAPEVPGTLSLEELEEGPALDDQRVDALVAFLRTLTDARYEALLPEAAAD